MPVRFLFLPIHPYFCRATLLLLFDARPRTSGGLPLSSSVLINTVSSGRTAVRVCSAIRTVSLSIDLLNGEEIFSY